MLAARQACRRGGLLRDARSSEVSGGAGSPPGQTGRRQPTRVPLPRPGKRRCRPESVFSASHSISFISLLFSHTVFSKAGARCSQSSDPCGCQPSTPRRGHPHGHACFLCYYAYIFLSVCTFLMSSSLLIPTNANLQGTWDYIPNSSPRGCGGLA